MANRFPALLALLVALPCAWAGTTPQSPAKTSPLTDRGVTRRVDDLLRASGTNLMLDQDTPTGLATFRRGTNRIYYYTSNKDNRLVRIEIEPIGEESPGSSKLAATFLVVLRAVESVDDGVRLADILASEFAKDGLTRSIALSNGMKFMKEKSGEAPAKYIIVF